MRSLGFIYSLFFIHRYIDSLLGYPKILMVLVTEPHLRYSLSAFNTCFLEYISQFLSVPVRVQVFVRTPWLSFFVKFYLNLCSILWYCVV